MSKTPAEKAAKAARKLAKAQARNDAAIATLAAHKAMPRTEAEIMAARRDELAGAYRADDPTGSANPPHLVQSTNSQYYAPGAGADDPVTGAAGSKEAQAAAALRLEIAERYKALPQTSSGDPMDFDATPDPSAANGQDLATRVAATYPSIVRSKAGGATVVKGGA